MTWTITITDNSQRKNTQTRPHTKTDWQPVKVKLYALIKESFGLNNAEIAQLRITTREVNLNNGTVLVKGYVVGDVSDRLAKKLNGHTI